MTKLSDLQLVLLSSAAARGSGSVMPPPSSIADHLTRIRKTLPLLLKRELVAEAEVTDVAQSWREAGDRHVGLFITDAGRIAIGAGKVSHSEEQTASTSPDAVGPSPRPTKSAQVVGLLRREQGATLAELVEATGWLPHTTRAALTGLRKKGHSIAKGKRGEITCYHLPEAA